MIIKLNSNMILKVSSIVILAPILSGCAVIQQQYCNTDAAYSEGMNDARANQDMESNYASSCSVNQSHINASYRRGYEIGLKNKPDNSQRTDTGDGWMCLSHVCGYGCIKDSYNEVYCGKRRYDTCITDTYGTIKCGKHCRIDMTSAKCEKERYSKGSRRPT
jgi:hypothetical protein